MRAASGLGRRPLVIETDTQRPELRRRRPLLAALVGGHPACDVALVRGERDPERVRAPPLDRGKCAGRVARFRLKNREHGIGRDGVGRDELARLVQRIDTRGAGPPRRRPWPPPSPLTASPLDAGRALRRRTRARPRRRRQSRAPADGHGPRPRARRAHPCCRAAPATVRPPRARRPRAFCSAVNASIAFRYVAIASAKWACDDCANARPTTARATHSASLAAAQAALLLP